MKSRYSNGRSVKTGHYVGLKFDDGWLFVNVLETERIDLKPYTLLNENNERDVIGAGEMGSEDDEIVDELSRNLVTPKDNHQEIFYQLLVGVAPSRMQIYPIFGRNRAPNLRGGAEPGDPQVPLTGYDSPYNDPTQKGEFFTTNAIQELSLQAYNPMHEPKEAKISIHVTKFKYSVVEDVELMRSFIDGRVNFRDHAMGLGALNTDQLSVPGWIEERFGDVILSTREIYEETQDVTNGQVGDAIQNGPELVENGGGR